MPDVIRAMTTRDIPVIARWVAQVPLWQRYQLDEAKLRRQLSMALQQQDLLLVAEDETEKRACGFTWVMLRGGFGRAYLRLIGVCPSRTGQGLGAALLKATEQTVAKQSPGLFLLVSDFNTAAQRFYLRHGYSQVGAIPAFVLPDITELIFYKVLQPT